MENIESIRKKFHKSIWSKFAKAITIYQLVKPGDEIAVCISSGKDSMIMAKLLQELMKKNIFCSVGNVNLNTIIVYKDDSGMHNFLDEYDD